MSNTLQWRVQGIVRDAKGRNDREYIIYAGETYTVVERIGNAQAARDYLEMRSSATTFKNPNGRYAKMHQRSEARKAKQRKHHGKTIVLHQRTVKTLSAAMKLAQQWHDDNS